MARLINRNLIVICRPERFSDKLWKKLFILEKDIVINDEKHVFRDQKIPQNSKVDPRYFSPLYHNSLANSKIQMKFSPSSVEMQTIQIMSFIYNLYTS